MRVDRELKVAFVACNKNAKLHRQDPAFIYRCDNLSYALSRLGVQTWTGHLSQFPWLQSFDLVVFHRPRLGWRFKWLCQWLRRRETKLVADFDDLVFIPSLARHSPGVVNGLVPLETTNSQFAHHANALAMVDHVTVSTHNLMLQVDENFNHQPVSCVPNAVHWSWRDKPLYGADSERSALAYMPGTRSHDHDFAWVRPAVARTLAANPHVHFQITGPLNHGLHEWGDRVVHQPKKIFAEYDQAFKGVGLNLAPLANSPFNDGKSALKVLEAAWWGIPTVFSHLPDALRLVGAGGVQANNLAEFEALMNSWSIDSDGFSPKPEALRQAVLQHADVFAFAQKWLIDVVGVSVLEDRCAA